MRNFVLLLVLFATALSAVEIHGLVVDENGAIPVKNMGIFADAQGTLITRSNDRGQFTLTVPDDQASTTIVVWREDVMGAGYDIDVATFRDRPFIVAVERGARIEVHVVDPAGRPIAEAKLSCSTHGGTTNAEGVSWMGPFSRMSGGHLGVSAEGYQQIMVSGIPVLSYQTQPLTVVLTPNPGFVRPEPAEPAKPASANGF